jgi:hypothetical protein
MDSCVNKIVQQMSEAQTHRTSAGADATFVTAAAARWHYDPDQGAR